MKTAQTNTTKTRKAASAAKPAHKPQSTTATRPMHSAAATKPTHEQLREAAYFNYLNGGCPNGQALEHWLNAESQLGS